MSRRARRAATRAATINIIDIGSQNKREPIIITARQLILSRIHLIIWFSLLAFGFIVQIIVNY